MTLMTPVRWVLLFYFQTGYVLTKDGMQLEETS